MAIAVSVGPAHHASARVTTAARSLAIGGDRPTDKLMAIGQAPRRSGFTVKALHFYERRGLLPPTGRSPAGYRLYSEADLHRLEFIRQAKGLGLPLEAIRELVGAAREQPRGRARSKLLQLLAERISADRRADRALTRLRTELDRRRQAVARRAPRSSTERGYCACLRDCSGEPSRRVILVAAFLFNLGQGVLRPSMPLYLQHVFGADYRMVTLIPVVFGAGELARDPADRLHSGPHRTPPHDGDRPAAALVAMRVAALPSARSSHVGPASVEQTEERPGACAEGARFVVDHVEMAPDPQPLEPERAKPAARDIAPDGVHRYEGYPEPRHHGLLDGLGVAELHGRPDLHASVLERALGDLTGRGPFFAHEEPLIGQMRRRDLAPPRPRMVSRHDEDQLVEEARGQALFAGVKRVSAHDPEIDLVPADALSITAEFAICRFSVTPG